VWLMSRPRRRACPHCGTDVKKGRTICPNCAYDFVTRQAGMTTAS
jgi:RNA polymerase subunit RPABC4/transcription elongation factor Spt4